MEDYLYRDRYNDTYNWLVQTKSPYLKQHETNPVNWLDWSSEAFEKAKRENKPVFVSIGYSTCHWCHVMEEESFEDKEVARVLNEHFISIKVDREERPDIDSVYMTVCQAMTGHGGWPLNVFLTPEQKPFYAGVYFPKESRYGMPGFMDVINQIAKNYHKDRDRVEEVGEKIVTALNEAQKRSGENHLKTDVLKECFGQFQQVFDDRFGGFGQEPKFPSPHQLMFLLRYHRWQEDDEALAMVIKTLDGMADGGIYDHIGYGFSRYSVDEKWLVPHFEKMLYDQALLMMAYTEAWQVVGHDRYRDITLQIMDYLKRDMRDSTGAFYSAEDADSEGIEGKFYIWSKDEILGVLGRSLGDLFCRAYNITEEGNFEGHNIPNLIEMHLYKLAETEKMAVDELKTQLKQAKDTLFVAREKRPRPHKDDKILTSWNALIIAALAKAGAAFDNKEALDLAESAFDFIEKTLTVDGQLMARFRDGEVKYSAYLEDYANMLWACDALYEATYQLSYLEKMKNYAKTLIDEFWDDETGGFGLYSQNQAPLIYNPKEAQDGATPSGNSVATMALLKLARRTGDPAFEPYVDQNFRAFSDEIMRHPMGYSWMLSAFMLTQMQSKELVVLQVGEGDVDVESVNQELQHKFLPEVFILAGKSGQLAKMAAFTTDYKPVDERTTYYLCENYQCQQPTIEVHKIINQLRS